MKNDIHPSYRFVVFKDLSSGFSFLSRSTIQTEESVKWEDGKEYPLVKLEISSKSHPFYTGKQRIVDTDNRVEAFEKRAKKVDSKSIVSKKEKRSKRRAKVSEIKGTQSLTLKDMLKQM